MEIFAIVAAVVVLVGLIAISSARSRGSSPRPHPAPASPARTRTRPTRGKELWIRYRAADGVETRRVVTVRQCERRASGDYLLGICHMRRDLRHFRIDRILEAIDRDTGEVLESHEIIRHLDSGSSQRAISTRTTA